MTTNTTRVTGPDNNQYTIGAHFLCALFYGDTSGLHDDETEQFDEWVRPFAECAGHWSAPEDAVPDFAHCEITGSLSECVTVEFVRIDWSGRAA